MLNFLARAAIDSVDWSGPWIPNDDSAAAAKIPELFEQLSTASDEREAVRAWNALRNSVIFAGDGLRPWSVDVVRVLLACLAGPLGGPVRVYVVDLLWEIGIDAWRDQFEPVESQISVRNVLSEAVWSLYALLFQPDGKSRYLALDLIGYAERDKGRLELYCHAIALNDDDSQVRQMALATADPDLRARYR